MKQLLLFSVLSLNLTLFAQKDYAKSILDTLCSDYFSGRGYINDGVEKSAEFIKNELKNIGVSNFPNQKYIQNYSFGVNTFPFDLTLKLDDSVLVAGQDYLLNANSGTAQGDFKVIEINSSNYLSVETQPSNTNTIVVFNFTDLNHKDSVNYFFGLAVKTAKYAPTIWVQKTKMMYSVGRRHYPYPMIVVDKKAYFKPKNITLKINNKYIPQYSNQNVIGYIPPAKKGLFHPEKYVVLSAHFDHLGKMGQAMFPGANDNASGVAILLSMAKYYVKNPSKYGIVFCFFSGEEAGLEGSRYFVDHPYFKLKKVKFVLNIDIMGGASKNITVVNGTKHPKIFNQMVRINQTKNYVTAVKKRGETSNSDHYFFSMMNVPAFFIYSGGEVKNYHDIYDTAENTPLTKFDEVQSLLIEFIEEL